MSNKIAILPNSIPANLLPSKALRNYKNKSNKSDILQTIAGGQNPYLFLRTAEMKSIQKGFCNWSCDYQRLSNDLDNSNNNYHIINFSTENIRGNLGENRFDKWKFIADKKGIYLINVNLLVMLEPFNNDLSLIYNYWLNYLSITNEKVAILSVGNYKTNAEIRQIGWHILRVDDFQQPVSNYFVNQVIFNGSTILELNNGENIDIRMKAVSLFSPNPLYFKFLGDVSVTYLGVDKNE